VSTLEQETETRLHVLFVNRSRGIALLSNGRTVPVTHWFDRFGGECDAEDAVACVAGSDFDRWFTLDLINNTPMRVH
jgi:hypothetical protein